MVLNYNIPFFGSSPASDLGCASVVLRVVVLPLSNKICLRKKSTPGLFFGSVCPPGSSAETSWKTRWQKVGQIYCRQTLRWYGFIFGSDYCTISTGADLVDENYFQKLQQCRDTGHSPDKLMPHHHIIYLQVNMRTRKAGQSSLERV